MIGNKLEQSIISVFQSNPSKTYSINEVAKILKKAYPHINHKANFFLKERILNKIEIGNSYQCYLNLRNEKTLVYLKINELNKKDTLLRSNRVIRLMQQKLLHALENAQLRSLVRTVLIHDGRLIFVLSSDGARAALARALGTDASYLDEESFKRLYMEDDRIKHDYLVLYGIDSYLCILAELNDHFVSKGLMRSLEKRGGGA